MVDWNFLPGNNWYASCDCVSTETWKMGKEVCSCLHKFVIGTLFFKKVMFPHYKNSHVPIFVLERTVDQSLLIQNPYKVIISILIIFDDIFIATFPDKFFSLMPRGRLKVFGVFNTLWNCTWTSAIFVWSSRAEVREVMCKSLPGCWPCNNGSSCCQRFVVF